jgi:hypothetical protein
MGTKMQERQFGASMSFAIAKSNDNHVKKVLEERRIPKDNVFSGQNFTLDGVPPHLTLAQIENEMRTTPCKTSRAGSGRSYSAPGEFRCVVSGSNRGRLPTAV